MLLCPLDALPLTLSPMDARCARGHCFDRAREGYLNLLPVQAKQAKDPGDSPVMVQARRAFLATGAYDPLMTAIADLCAHHATGLDATLLDAGCGEGAYLCRIHAARPGLACYGLDISKHAVRAAAKTEKAVTWLVASNKSLPFPDRSLDIILCAFGFPVWPEFRRVLKPGGRILLADPGPDHLIELRRALYADIKPKPGEFQVPDGFILSVVQQVRAGFTAPRAALRDLIAMTPHQHRAAPEKMTAVLTADGLDLTLDVALRILQPA